MPSCPPPRQGRFRGRTDGAGGRPRARPPVLRGAGVARGLRVAVARRRERLRWQRRTSSFWRRPPTCSAATTSGCAAWSERISSTLDADEAAARRAVCDLGRHRPGAARRGGRRDRLARPCAAAARARRARLRGAWLSVASASCSSTRRRATSRLRPPRPPRPPRSASASATADLVALAAARAGLALIKQGQRGGGARACWTRRWSRSSTGRAVADRDRAGVLQRDRRAVRRCTSCAGPASGPRR